MKQNEGMVVWLVMGGEVREKVGEKKMEQCNIFVNLIDFWGFAFSVSDCKKSGSNKDKN